MFSRQLQRQCEQQELLDRSKTTHLVINIFKQNGPEELSRGSWLGKVALYIWPGCCSAPQVLEVNAAPSDGLNIASVPWTAACEVASMYRLAFLLPSAFNAT